MEGKNVGFSIGTEVMYESGPDEQSPHEVLLIEDNPGDARLVEILLGESGVLNCKVTNKVTLAEGLAALEEKDDYAAILLDFNLPDSRGFETLEQLLARFPNNNVIALTGLSDKSMGVKAVKAGAQDFLIKGAFDSEMLEKSLRYSIERNKVLKRLEETQRIAHIGSWEFKPTTQTFTASDEVYKIFGLLPRETKYSYQDIHSPDCPFHILYEITEEALTQKLVKKDVKIERKDGKSSYVFIQCTLIKGSDHTPVVNGIIQDITERKQSEALRQARDVARQSAKMKEQLLASISHEMRTPMNAILGMSNLVLKTDLNEEQHGYIKSIKQSSEILLGVVNDILEISTLQNGKIIFESKPFDLHELLANLVNVMQYKVKEKDLTFELNIDQRIPKVIKGDKLRLNQILYNLVGNAIKFTDEGFVKISVLLLAQNEEKVHLKFIVEDSGIGIPEDKVKAIFDTFTRIRQKDRLYEGTGLGLSIAKNLVEQQEGVIGADSVLGKGSVFFFEIEFETTDLMVDEDKKEEEELANIDTSRKFRLLLVEDNKMNQLVAKKTLEKQWENIEVVIADNGKIAIEILEKNTFDIILMDIQMPIMDGYEATVYIRNNMPPEIARIPILAMTAHAHISKDEKFKNYKMDDFVLKPFEPKQLFKKVAQYTNQNRHTDE